MEDQTINVFISHADADKELYSEFKKHLNALVNNKYIEISDKASIKAGELESKTIEAIDRAHIVIILMSADLLGSELFTEGEEYKRIFERLNRDDISVIPVILRGCRWDEYNELKKLKLVLPRDGKPVVQEQKDRDEAWLSIVKEVKDVRSNLIDSGKLIQKTTVSSYPVELEGLKELPENFDDTALSICISKISAREFSCIICPPKIKNEDYKGLQTPIISNCFPRKVADLLQRIMLEQDSGSTEIEPRDFEVLGEALYNHLLPTERSRDFFINVFQEYKRKPLKIILHFDEDTKEIATLPWEYLYVPENVNGPGFFVGKEEKLTLTRRLKSGSGQSKPRIELSKIGVVQIVPPETIVEKLEKLEKDASATLKEIMAWDKGKSHVDKDPKTVDSIEAFKKFAEDGPYSIVHLFGECSGSTILFRGKNGKQENPGLHELLDLFDDKPNLVFLHTFSDKNGEEAAVSLRELAFDLVCKVDGVIAIQVKGSEELAQLTSDFYKNLSSKDGDFDLATAAVARSLVNRLGKYGISASFSREAFKVIVNDSSQRKGGDQGNSQENKYRCPQHKIEDSNGKPKCELWLQFNFDNVQESQKCYCPDLDHQKDPNDFLWPCPMCVDPDVLTNLRSHSCPGKIDKKAPSGHLIADWPIDAKNTPDMPEYVKALIQYKKHQLDIANSQTKASNESLATSSVPSAAASGFETGKPGLKKEDLQPKPRQ